MPKWLQQMFVPTLMLWLYAIAFAILSTLTDGRISFRADFISRAALSLILASWVIADVRKRHRPLCYDYDSFIFFAWPVVLPVYLFRTRGARAFLTLLCFAGIWLVAYLASVIVFIIREIVFGA